MRKKYWKVLFFGPRVWPLPHRVGSTGSPYVRGGPRLNGRSFGLCWNSGQNDLHIEFLVLLPLHRLQIVATTHLHIFRDPSERISNVEVLSRPLDYPLRKVYSSFFPRILLVSTLLFFPESGKWRAGIFPMKSIQSEVQSKYPKTLQSPHPSLYKWRGQRWGRG